MVKTTLRIPDDLMARVRAAAAADRRSENAELLVMIEAALDAREAEKAQARNT
jgi:predicted transcriptional regulator